MTLTMFTQNIEENVKYHNVVKTFSAVLRLSEHAIQFSTLFDETQERY